MKLIATALISLVAMHSFASNQGFRGFVVVPTDSGRLARACRPFQGSEAMAVRAVVSEAANQGYRGMLAVADALRNRGSLQGVFGLRNTSLLARTPRSVWQQARRAWQASLRVDITVGATNWENTGAFGTPYWAQSMTPTVKIKQHQFYR